MIPKNVKFDRYAQMSEGFVAVSLNSPLIIQANGIALVTGWLSNGPWNPCDDGVVTSWSACPPAPATSWTPVSAPTTTWTPL